MKARSGNDQKSRDDENFKEILLRLAGRYRRQFNVQITSHGPDNAKIWQAQLELPVPTAEPVFAFSEAKTKKEAEKLACKEAVRLIEHFKRHGELVSSGPPTSKERGDNTAPSGEANAGFTSRSGRIYNSPDKARAALQVSFSKANPPWNSSVHISTEGPDHCKTWIGTLSIPVSDPSTGRLAAGVAHAGNKRDAEKLAIFEACRVAENLGVTVGVCAAPELVVGATQGAQRNWGLDDAKALLAYNYAAMKLPAPEIEHVSTRAGRWIASIRLPLQCDSRFVLGSEVAQGDGGSKKDSSKQAAFNACLKLEQAGWLTIPSGGPRAADALALAPLTVELNAEQQDAIQRLLHAIPTDLQAAPVSSAAQTQSAAAAGATRGWGAYEPPDTAQLNQDMAREWTQRLSEPTYAAMLQGRQKLPIWQHRGDVVECINHSQVVIVSGETGSGKTTQIPQFILEDMVMRGVGASCRIIVTQPRRIAAISVAHRLAAELGDPRVGVHVGYQVRLESVQASSAGNVTLCTAGILLRRLQSDRELEGVSHVILDEIHERDLNCDLLLVILKDVLRRRPQLRLILMSATINARLFADYFAPCPTIEIAGHCFPVRDLFLEDVVEMTRYCPRPSSFPRRSPGPWGANWKARPADDPPPAALDASTYSQSTMDAVRRITEADDPDTQLDLLEHVLVHICLEQPAGAVLVFVAGWDDINRLTQRLNSNPRLSSSKVSILQLHSTIPPADQRKVFDRVADGVRKVVLATNIAESSITVDDIVYVVDTGRVKEKSHDVVSKISSLCSVWVSRASAHQRSGRAGRVQAGVCYKLYTRQQWDHLMPYPLPEMLRMPLEEVCLQIKALQLGAIVPFLSNALEAPPLEAVQGAVMKLYQLGALDAYENLTHLGEMLAALPVDPSLGKMIIYGTVLGCMDAVLGMAAGMGYREPFVCPVVRRNDADAARKSFAISSLSDELGVLNAIQEYERHTRIGDERNWMLQMFVSPSIMRTLLQLRQQFRSLLSDTRLLPPPASGAAWSFDPNRHNQSVPLVRAMLVAGLFPNVVRIHPKLSSKERACKFRTKLRHTVHVHPSSVNYGRTADLTPFQWILYREKIKTTLIFIRDTTVITPLPLILFGNTLQAIHSQSPQGQLDTSLVVDGWIEFHTTAQSAKLLENLRNCIAHVLHRRIITPNEPPSAADTAVVDTLVYVLEQEARLVFPCAAPPMPPPVLPTASPPSPQPGTSVPSTPLLATPSPAAASNALYPAPVYPSYATQLNHSHPQFTLPFPVLPPVPGSFAGEQWAMGASGQYPPFCDALTHNSFATLLTSWQSMPPPTQLPYIPPFPTPSLGPLSSMHSQSNPYPPVHLQPNNWDWHGSAEDVNEGGTWQEQRR